MRFLRTNTAVRLTVGPFFDKTDGVTPETALTVTSCKLTLMVDDANVPTLVLDTAPTASGGANDMVHVTGDDAGFYDLELAAGNVNYLGRAMLAITDAATHCPVFHEFMILPAMIYDSLVLGTDDLDTNVTKMNNVSASAITTIKAVQGLATDGVVPTVTNLTNLPAGRVIPAGDIGDFPEDAAAVVLRFNTVGVTMAPITLAGTPAISVYKDSTTQSTAGVTLTVDYDSVTGMHHVLIDTSADAFYEVGKSYTVVITTGTVSGVSVVGAVVGSFSIENRFQEVDVVKLGASAQSATDLKDFADDGYDPSTNKITGVVLADTVTTYTGNTPQTGDAYAIVNSVAHGNAALKTLIDAVDNFVDTEVAAIKTVVDAIQAKTDNLPTDPADQSAVAALIDAVDNFVDTEVAAILSDTNAIKAVTDLLTAADSEPTGVPAADATPLVKLAWLFMALRNKVTITSTKKTFYDDAGGAEWEKDLADDGSEYSESEGNAI